MSKGNWRREMSRIATSDRGKSWKKRAKKHLLEDLEAQASYRSSKLVGLKLGSGRVICTKAKFPNQEAAQRRLAEILAEAYGENRKPVRAYECTHCGNWHLTSWPGIDERPT